MSLELQIQQFISYGDPALSPLLPKPNTLIASWIGINDIADSAKISRANRSPTYYATLQAKHMQLFDRVYDLGYRHFLFLNLPPLDRIPAFIGAADPRVNRTMVRWFNDELESAVGRFAGNHSDASVGVFDVDALLRRVLDEPRRFQIVNTTGFCAGFYQLDVLTRPWKYGCKPLRGYFWYDSLHVTFRVHEIIASALRTFLR